MMNEYDVRIAIARGAELFTGRGGTTRVHADSRLDAAIEAEDMVNATLGPTEYAHTRSVRAVPVQIAQAAPNRALPLAA